MKTGALLVIAIGCGLAACGSGSKQTAQYTTVSPTTQGGSALTFTAPTTLTVAGARTGAPVRCTNHGVAAGAMIPSRGQGVSGSANGTSASAMLTLKRRNDGSLVVSCGP